MPLVTVVPYAQPLAPGVWSAELDKDDLLRLGTPLHPGGGRSVVLLTGRPEYSTTAAELRLAAGSVVVASIGLSGGDTLFVDLGVSPTIVGTEETPARPVEIPDDRLDGLLQIKRSWKDRGDEEPELTHEQLVEDISPPEVTRPSEIAARSAAVSDQAFLDSLAQFPHDLADLARELLRGVRQTSPKGQLHLAPTSGRWVERPNNFWTVKVQPRARSVAITMRGSVENHSSIPGIDVKTDRGSYSRFTVRSTSQIAGAGRLLREAQML